MTQWALMQFSDSGGGEYHAVEIVREGKRFAWVDWGGAFGVVRETRSRTAWRFESHEAACAAISEAKAKQC